MILLILFKSSSISTNVSVSRKGLYDELDHSEESDHKVYMPMGFEFVEVDVKENEESKEGEGEGEGEDEFDFPLFAAAPQVEERGRSPTKTMKVSLREESVEEIKNERPDAFYFARYTEKERDQFKMSAVTIEQIEVFAMETHPDPKPWQHIDVEQHNSRIDNEKKKKKRPGKKDRKERIMSRIRRDEREKLAKKLAREERAKLKKMRRKHTGHHEPYRAKRGMVPQAFKENH